MNRPAQSDTTTSDLQDELRNNWGKWQELIDPNNEAMEQVVAITLSRLSLGEQAAAIHDVRDSFIDHAVEMALLQPWYGMWGDLKLAAGLQEPRPEGRFSPELIKEAA